MVRVFVKVFGLCSALFAGVVLFAPLSVAAPSIQDSDVEAVGKMMGLENKALFSCAAETEGQIACQQNKKCICKWWPEDKMRMRPAGFRWDCGIKRPRCEMPRNNQQNQQVMPPVMVSPDILQKKKKNKKKKN